MIARPSFVESAGGKFMPYLLKKILNNYGIKQTEWSNSVMQFANMPLSSSAASQLINWGIWPKATKPQLIKDQTEIFLRSRGVPEDVIATAWVESKESKNVSRRPIKTEEDYRKTKAAAPDIDPIGEPEMLSPNAKRHFNIFKDPFKDEVASAEDVFTSADIRYIREAMFTTAKHGGLLAVIGESGGGKSILRKDLIERINRDREQIMVIFPRTIDKTRLNATSICEAIIRDLQPGAQVPSSLEGKARAVEKILKASAEIGNKHVVIIEEAHDITIQCMKYLKRFWELEDGFKKLLAIILIGQPELSAKLNEGSNPDAREFIRRCEVAHLVPLDRNLEEYLKFKFDRIGKRFTDIAEPDVIEAIQKRLTKQEGGRFISHLNPQLVNNLVTKALNLCAEIGEEKLSAEVIKKL